MEFLAIACGRVRYGKSCPKSSVDVKHLFTVDNYERKHLPFKTKIKSLGIALRNAIFMYKKMFQEEKQTKAQR